MVILERMRKILVMEISPKYFNDIIFLWHTKYIESYRKTCMLFITKKCADAQKISLSPPLLCVIGVSMQLVYQLRCTDCISASHI
jgi:hypothetical protein